MITVKHKKGRHAPNWSAILYCYGKLLFARRVRVTVITDEHSAYTVDEPAFFKVCGWKNKLEDGALDKSVRETLLAYMPEGKGLKFYGYWREGKGNNPVHTHPTFSPREGSVVYIMSRMGFWPAFPWAGGNEPDETPNNDFQYKLKIERV